MQRGLPRRHCSASDEPYIKPAALLAVTRDIVTAYISDGEGVTASSTADLVLSFTRRLANLEYLSEFTAPQLAEIIPMLVSLWHEADSQVPREKRLAMLEASSQKLTLAIASRSLSPSAMVGLIWAYSAEEVIPKHSRDLYDQVNLALQGFPPMEYKSSCIGCSPSYVDPTVESKGDNDEPCPVEDVRTLIPLSTLGAEELGRVAWSFARARALDERWRVMKDRSIFDLIAKVYTGEHVATTEVDLTLGLLQIYSSIPHYEPGFYDIVASSLSKKLDQFTDPSLVLSATSSFARVKHGRSSHSKLFLIGVFKQALDLIEAFEPIELIRVSCSMGDLGISFKPWLFAINEKIVQSHRNVEPSDVLSLVRALAALQHLEDDYTSYQDSLLTCLRTRYLDSDVDDLSSHCGSGSSGLEK